MLYEIFTVTLLTVSAPQVEVRPLDGPPISGELQSLSAQELIVEGKQLPTESPTDRHILAAGTLLHVRPLQPAMPSETAASLWLELVDGSRLQAISYLVNDNVAAVTLTSGRELTIPTRAIEWVLFKSQSEELSQAWRGLLGQAAAGDRLVVRRVVEQPAHEGGQPRTVESLDFLGGVLGNLSPDKLQFQFDGRDIEVSREKAEGLIYHHAAGRSLPVPLCIATTVDGDLWNLKSVELSEGALELVSVAGVRHSLPLEEVRLLDFSAGKIVYLSDLEPESSQWRSFFGDKNELPSLKQLFAPRRDQNFEGGPLKLHNQVFAKGLAVHSYSEMVYRLPGEFRKLAAVAGIDDSLGDNGHVVLRIFADKELVLEKAISGADVAPVPIDLDVAGVRTLRIEVDFGENLDIADHLNLGDIRVMK